MSEMPWPWIEMWRFELDLYRRIKDHKSNDLTDEGITAGMAKYTNQKPWKERIPKAAFFASYRPLRRLVWDQAALRPDLIDAPFHLSDNNVIEPWVRETIRETICETIRGAIPYPLLLTRVILSLTHVPCCPL